MAMVGVHSGNLYRRTHSLSRLVWSWVGGCLALFYIHQMNRVNSRNGSATMTAPQTLSWNYSYYYYYHFKYGKATEQIARRVATRRNTKLSNT